MNILFVNNHFPLFEGSDSGASNRSNMFISALAELGYVDVVSFRNDVTSNIRNCEIVYNNEIADADEDQRFDKFFKLFAFHSPNKIYNVNREKEKVVDEILGKKKYDYVSCRYIREAVECGLLKYSSKLIIDVDDNPRNVVLMASKSARTLRNRIYNRLFAYTIDRMVKYVLKDVFCSFHSNPLQAPIDKSIYLHNVTMSDAELPLITGQTPLQVMMIGLFHYGPNIEGLEHFLTNVWPIVHQKNPHIVFNVVGKIGDDALKRRWSKYEGVNLKGFVQNIVEEYKASRVVIVPIYSGSGTSVKVVEAMKLNRACVSTIEGVRGYDKYLIEGDDYLLAKDDMDFANKLTSLVADIDKCNQLAESAYVKIELYYSQSSFKGIVKSAITSENYE